MDFSNDEKHRETLAVLESVLSYLERLPKHPATHGVCAMARAHLALPLPQLVKLGRRELHGTGPVAPAGMPLLEANVVERHRDDSGAAQLTLSLPTGLRDGDKEYVLAELSQRLRKGSVQLGLQARSMAPEEGRGRD